MKSTRRLTCGARESEAVFVVEGDLGSHPGHGGAVHAHQDVLRLDISVDNTTDIVKI